MKNKIKMKQCGSYHTRCKCSRMYHGCTLLAAVWQSVSTDDLVAVRAVCPAPSSREISRFYFREASRSRASYHPEKHLTPYLIPGALILYVLLSCAIPGTRYTCSRSASWFSSLDDGLVEISFMPGIVQGSL